MEVLQSRVLLRPADYDRSVAFYREVLGLHIYREWATGTVFFLGGGLLELSRSADPVTDDKLSLWLQVRDVDAEFARLNSAGVTVVEAPDAATIARVSVALGARGSAKLQTLTALTIDEFLAALD